MMTKTYLINQSIARLCYYMTTLSVQFEIPSTGWLDAKIKKSQTNPKNMPNMSNKRPKIEKLYKQHKKITAKFTHKKQSFNKEVALHPLYCCWLSICRHISPELE